MRRKPLILAITCNMQVSWEEICEQKERGSKCHAGERRYCEGKKRQTQHTAFFFFIRALRTKDFAVF